MTPTTTTHVRQLHSYRAQLLPRNCEANDVEDLADDNLLPTINVRAANADQATEKASLVSGKHVLRVERIERAEG